MDDTERIKLILVKIVNDLPTGARWVIFSELNRMHNVILDLKEKLAKKDNVSLEDDLSANKKDLAWFKKELKESGGVITALKDQIDYLEGRLTDIQRAFYDR